MSIIEKRKQKKMNLVFTTVRENPDYTKTEIKASTGLSMESVIQYVDTLVQDNCLYYSGSRGANVGRKGDCLRVNPDGAYFIGTKFTDLTVDTVLVNLAGDIIANESTTVTAASMTVDELIKHIFAGIDNILCTLDSAHKQKIKAIGIAAPGFIDSEQGIVREYFNIADGATIRLRQILEERYGIATYMSHTVKTKAIAYTQRLFVNNIRGTSTMKLCTNSIRSITICKFAQKHTAMIICFYYTGLCVSLWVRIKS